MKKLFLAILLACFTFNSYAGLIIYTDREVWASAISGDITTEDFNSITPFDMSSGINSVGVLDIETFDGPSSNRIDGGSSFANIDASNYYHGAIDLSTGSTMVEILTSPIFAFGADWRTTTTGGDLILTILSDTIAFTDYFSGSGDGFLGVISDSTFSAITLDTAEGNAEQFGMDNFSYHVGTSVPEPASLALIGLGLVGIRLSRKKKTD